MKSFRLLALVAASGLLVTAASTFVSLPMAPCPFRAMAHLPCPGCGMTRSIAAIWRGDLPLSFRYHPLGLPVFAGAILGCVLPFAGPRIQQRLILSPPALRIASLTALTALLLVWVVRLITIYSGGAYFLW